MLKDLFIKVFPIIIGGLGSLCYKFPNPMRRLLFFIVASLSFLGILVISFAGGFLFLYNGVTKDLDSSQLSKKFPCDTGIIKIGHNYDEGINISQAILSEHEQIAASNFQYFGNFAFIAFCTAIGLLIVTYISTYISNCKRKKFDNNSNNNPPPPPP